MSKLDLANVYGISFKDEYGAVNFSIDSDLLRKDPDVVVRKQFYESVNKLNSTDEYTSYGIVMYAMPSLTDPKLPINIMKKKLLDDPTMTFTEYLVMPIDSSHPTIETFLHTAEDILKSTTLIRCSCDIDTETLAQGSLVKIHFDNNRKENATIVEKYSKIPPLNTDRPSKKQDAAAKPFTPEPCSTNSQSIAPSADAVAESSVDDTVNQASQPGPKFSSAKCSNPAAPIIYTPPPQNIVAAKAGDTKKLISKYFTLRDLTVTDHTECGKNYPDNQSHLDSLIYLANNLLDKLAEKYGRENILISSAYRSDCVNEAVKGAGSKALFNKKINKIIKAEIAKGKSPEEANAIARSKVEMGSKSQHCFGQAADVKFLNFKSKEDIINRFEEIIKRKKELRIDQAILETENPSSCWFHLSTKSSGTIRNKINTYIAGTYNLYDRETFLAELKKKNSGMLGGLA